VKKEIRFVFFEHVHLSPQFIQMPCKLIVKSSVYKHWLVYCLFLIFSCSTDKPWENDVMKQVWDAADQRDANWLKRYLLHPDEDIRLCAAKLAASFTDTSIVFIELIKNQIQVESHPDVIRHLVFAAGQSRDTAFISVLKKSFQESNDLQIKKASLVALSKISSTKIPPILDEFHATSNTTELFCEAWFYRSIHEPLTSYAILKLWDFLGEKNKLEESRFYALSALLRSKQNLSFPGDSILRNSTLNNSVDEKRLWPRFFVKCDIIAPLNNVPLLWNSLDSYAKIGVLSEIQRKTSADRFKPIIRIALDEKLPALRELAVSCLHVQPNLISDKILLDYFQKEADFRVRYLLAAAILGNGSEFHDELMTQLQHEYLISDNEYVKSEILLALGNSFASFEFLERETFTTPSILIQQAGYRALIQIRKSPQFNKYTKMWEANFPKGNALHQHFNALLTQALKTKDVALIALSAEVLRDPNSVHKVSNQNPLGFDDINLLNALRKGLMLPRDIEIAGELDKTIAHLEGKTAPIAMKPMYNNPINWKLVSRIPSNQRIKFSFKNGHIVIQLWPDVAPGTVGFIVSLIQKGFYVGKSIHRVVPGFVAQGGCPRGDGWGSLESTIRSEFSSTPFQEGTIGMASAGPDTESCQWFITLSNTPHLNGRYTAFGRVEEGMEVVHALRIGDRILNAELLP